MHNGFVFSDDWIIFARILANWFMHFMRHAIACHDASPYVVMDSGIQLFDLPERLKKKISRHRWTKNEAFSICWQNKVKTPESASCICVWCKLLVLPLFCQLDRWALNSINFGKLIAAWKGAGLNRCWIIVVRRIASNNSCHSLPKVVTKAN